MSDTNNVNAIEDTEQLARQVEADKAITELQTLEKLATMPSENVAIAS